MEGYNLNERMARYEPESALCEFCGVTENTNLEDYYEVMLYKETDRMNAVIVSSTSYSMVQVLIPCCSPCRVKRNDVKMKSATIGGLQGVLAGIVVGSVLYYFIGGAGIVLSSLFTIGISVLRTAKLEPKYAQKLGIPTEENIIYNSKFIQRMLTGRGWTTQKPRA
jgi:hypothetical protein